ncbi:MAG: type II toxin-antitoxin system RatA family toxin [Gammaproteobacteria bacterium]|nr:type II toxin-antitoxin system RatA family toxin [Gammaproteobacteria bacterium]
MTVIQRSAIVPFEAERMYALVNDVAGYPAFLPWCRQATVLEAGEDTLSASMELHKGPLHYTLTTRNDMTPGESIRMTLVDGPFKHLNGFWQFKPLGETGCDVSLQLEFEFQNRMVAMALGKTFDHIANTLVDSFCERAFQLYGAG